MKTWTTVAAMLALVLCVGVARADDKPAAKEGNKEVAKANRVAGEITKIDGASITVQPVKKEGSEAKAAVTFATTDATVVKVGMDKKSVSDLKVGQKVNATLDAEGKHATAINVMVKKEGGEGHK